ncbi:MAG: adenylate/guanylate cyclase domain-containing protein, partial [Leptospiraceae bacterium]|nr:adenylate/guanylate cyclase domain-containing protein [Leptospiraceae bacterium]
TASMRFVPMEFLRILKKESIVDVELGNQVQKEMCVLFSDIRSFTTLSESMTPPENFAFINSYLRRMGPVIRKHGGFIDKYIGDAIMALFDGGVSSGVDASVDMMRTLHTWNAGRGKYGYDPVTIGIGLHAGPLMLGTIGENERMEGTVISDAVNLAARVEGLTKKYGTAILITDAIQQTIAANGKYQTRFVDRVRVKGKQDAVSIFEVLDGLSTDEQDLRLKTRERFDNAVSLYVRGEFDAAGKLFTEILKLGQDPATEVYIRRCRSLLQSGVPADWDGTIVLDSK